MQSPPPAGHPNGGDPPPIPELKTAPTQAALPAFGALVLAIGAPAAALSIALVQHFEGTVLWGHRDPIGVISACTGHTATARLGQRYTPDECRRLLASDLVAHARELDCVRAQRPLQAHEVAALLSITFNVGRGRAGVKDGICELKRGGPSTIARRVAAGDMPGACASISDWTGLRGVDCRQAPDTRGCAGILRRRDAERAMCEGRYMGAPGAAGQAS